MFINKTFQKVWWALTYENIVGVWHFKWQKPMATIHVEWLQVEQMVEALLIFLEAGGLTGSAKRNIDLLAPIRFNLRKRK
jgi:hypothetical protein